ncbi:hypothetical protein LINPERHAP1_LOCUS14421 [Linum perenne]
MWRTFKMLLELWQERKMILDLILVLKVWVLKGQKLNEVVKVALIRIRGLRRIK